LLWLFQKLVGGRGGHSNYLPELALNHDPPSLNLPNR
jgi:hypothetical protein